MYIAKQNISFSAQDIANKINGNLLGDKDCKATCLSSFEMQNENALSFFTNKSDKRILEAIENQNTKILLINDIKSDFKVKEGHAVIKVANPHEAFLNLIPLFYDDVPAIKGVNEKSDIGKNVIIGENFTLGAFSSIGDNTIIGNNVTIHPNCTIYPNVTMGNNVVIHSGATIRENCILGDNVVIQNGAIIGADGFGYVPDPKMGIRPVPQVGNVKLESFVDIGANACVDRAAVATTHIGFCTKVDNLVQIGHNVQIGNFSFLCGQTGIAGSAKIGNQVTLAGGVGVADHVKIVDGTRISGRSAVTGDILEKGDYMGFPARPAMKQKRIEVLLEKLPDTIREIKNEIKK